MNPARASAFEINRCAARYFYENLNAQTPEAALARKYWKEKRGLSDAAIRRFRAGLCARMRASALSTTSSAGVSG